MASVFDPVLVFAVCDESPQHAETDLVARLNEVGRGSGSHQRFEAFLGVFVDRLIGRPAPNLPGVGNCLLSGVCPRVAVVEVEHEQEACVLDALAELLDILQILHHTLVRIVRGIDEESHAHRVPALLFQEFEHVCDGCPILVEILSVLLFKLRQD